MVMERERERDIHIVCLISLFSLSIDISKTVLYVFTCMQHNATYIYVHTWLDMHAVIHVGSSGFVCTHVEILGHI